MLPRHECVKLSFRHDINGVSAKLIATSSLKKPKKLIVVKGATAFCIVSIN
jgi:hypothetical protein